MYDIENVSYKSQLNFYELMILLQISRHTRKLRKKLSVYHKQFIMGSLYLIKVTLQR